MLACPTQVCTVSASTPLAIHSDTAVWRKMWSVYLAFTARSAPLPSSLKMPAAICNGAMISLNM